MRPVDHPFVSAVAFVVAGNLGASMMDADLAAAHHDADLGPD